MKIHDNDDATRKYTIGYCLSRIYTIHITQQNFGLPVRKNDKIVRKVTDNFS